MAEMELGRKISYYRKERGLSQEKVAEYMGVSRQAVAKWESDASRPSTDNLLKLAQLLDVKVEVLLGKEEVTVNAKTDPIVFNNTPWGFIGISLLSILIYVVFSAWKDIFSIGTLICTFVMAVPVQLFLHVYFVNAIKSNNFSGIAGYNDKKEYHLEEVKKLLLQIDLHTSMITTVFIGLICVMSCIDIGVPWLSGVLLCLYILEFVGMILYYNYKAIDRIYRRDADKERAKAEFPLMVAYIVVLCIGIGLVFLLFELKEIENNTMPALKLGGMCIVGTVVATIGLLRCGKGRWLCMVLALVLYLMMGCCVGDGM